MKQKKLALSLSGGGARAFCYFGFLRGLESQKINVDYIGALSGAAIMLCYLASGDNDEKIIQEFSKSHYSSFKFLSPRSIVKGGIFSPIKLQKFLNKYTGEKDIADLPYKTIIFTSDVTNFDKPQQIANSNGDLAKIATISSIIPPIFPLYRENKRLYGDGGLTTLYGASKLRSIGAEVVIGLYPDGLHFTNIPVLFNDSVRMLKSVMTAREDYERLNEPVDLEIRGFNTSASLTDFKKSKEMFNAGYEIALEKAKQIKKLIY